MIEIHGLCYLCMNNLSIFHPTLRTFALCCKEVRNIKRTSDRLIVTNLSYLLAHFFPTSSPLSVHVCNQGMAVCIFTSIKIVYSPFRSVSLTALTVWIFTNWDRDCILTLFPNLCLLTANTPISLHMFCTRSIELHFYKLRKEIIYSLLILGVEDWVFSFLSQGQKSVGSCANCTI